MRARLLLVAASVAAVSSPALAPSATPPPRDHAAEAWTVLPPGANGSLAFDRNTRDQAALYDGLTPLRGAVRPRDVKRWFKPAPLGLGGEKARRVERPRAGVVVARDRYGVPHVSGRTVADVAFGAGWVTASDRGSQLELLRGPARLAVLDVPGLDPFEIVLSGKTFVPSAGTEAFLANQLDALRATSRLGRPVAALMSAYVAGINAWYAGNRIKIQPYTANDVVAAAALVAARFGAGGGREVLNSELLSALREALGSGADSVFADLRAANDVEAPVSVPGSFAQSFPAASGPGAVVLDDGSFEGALPPQRVTGSSALLVGARRSVTGYPLFVAGPQLGYAFPSLLHEVDLQGAGFAVRGVLFPGLPFAVVGRGPDFVWSAGSSQADVVDVFVDTLCDGSDLKYTYLGRCLPMRRVDAGVLRADGEPDQPVVFYETANGPLIGYARVDGVRVGISMRRSTRGRELLSTRALYELNTQRVTSARSFLTTMGRVEFASNWFYADDRDIAMFSSGRLPIRAPGADPGLPTVGTGEFDWLGFLSAAEHAQALNPTSGAILNWSNKPAANVGASDSNFSFGSVHRVELLRSRIARSRKHSLATVVAAMNEAATQDLRAVEVWPVVRAVLDQATAPTGRAAASASLVDRWLLDGGSRLDRDLDGNVDAAGAAVLDRAWEGLTEAVLSPVLGALTARLAAVVPRDEPPGSGGSGFASGWYGYVEKDLRAILGRPVRDPFSTRFCGAGDLRTCAESLWEALDEAARALEAAQGSDPEGWRVAATKERIRFAPGLLPDTMRWTNRPTYQQVMSFSSHRARR